MSLNLKESRLLRISSKDKSPESPSKYQITYKTNDNDLHQIKRVVLKSAIIPNSQYNIHHNNNTLVFIEGALSAVEVTVPPNNWDEVTDGVVGNELANIDIISGELPADSGETNKYIIPVGQYTITMLIATLENTISGLKITQSPLTKKLTLTYGSPFSMPANEEINPMAKVLGITEDLDGVSTYSCKSLPDLSGLENVYIASQTLSNHSAMICNDKQKQSIFCSVGINVSFGQTMILEEDTTSLDYTEFYGARNISTIDITLLDENNNVLDFNGLDWVLTFRVYK